MPIFFVFMNSFHGFVDVHTADSCFCALSACDDVPVPPSDDSTDDEVSALRLDSARRKRPLAMDDDAAPNGAADDGGCPLLSDVDDIVVVVVAVAVLIVSDIVKWVAPIGTVECDAIINISNTHSLTHSQRHNTCEPCTPNASEKQ